MHWPAPPLILPCALCTACASLPSTSLLQWLLTSIGSGAISAPQAWTIRCPFHVHASTRVHAHSHAPPMGATASHHGRRMHNTAAVAEPQHHQQRGGWWAPAPTPDRSARPPAHPLCVWAAWAYIPPGTPHSEGRAAHSRRHARLPLPCAGVAGGLLPARAPRAADSIALGSPVGAVIPWVLPSSPHAHCPLFCPSGGILPSAHHSPVCPHVRWCLMASWLS